MKSIILFRGFETLYDAFDCYAIQPNVTNGWSKFTQTASGKIHRELIKHFGHYRDV